MPVPTVNVTCTASDQNGNSVAGARYQAKLDQTEIYQGFVVAEVVDGVADANGVCVLRLWPNALGVAGSLYKITATNPDTGKKFLNTLVSVPNSACNLHQILVQEPYPAVDASQQALLAAQGALAPVTAQASIATTQATNASASATAAAGSATTASTQATNASASATTAANAATSATASASTATTQATTATTKAAEAAASAASFSIQFAQMATAIIDTQNIVVAHHAFA